MLGEHAADRLESEPVTTIGDELNYHGSRGSSSREKTRKQPTEAQQLVLGLSGCACHHNSGNTPTYQISTICDNSVTVNTWGYLVGSI